MIQEQILAGTGTYFSILNWRREFLKCRGERDWTTVMEAQNRSNIAKEKLSRVLPCVGGGNNWDSHARGWSFGRYFYRGSKLQQRGLFQPASLNPGVIMDLIQIAWCGKLRFSDCIETVLLPLLGICVCLTYFNRLPFFYERRVISGLVQGNCFGVFHCLGDTDHCLWVKSNSSGSTGGGLGGLAPPYPSDTR